jgi:hypothetical protein
VSRMNWDRVNRENRAWRAARRAPDSSEAWELDRDALDRWHRAQAERPIKIKAKCKTKAKAKRSKAPRSKVPMPPWAMGASKNVRPPRRRQKLAKPNIRRQSKGLTEDKRREIERRILARWEKQRPKLLADIDKPIRVRRTRG